MPTNTWDDLLSPQEWDDGVTEWDTDLPPILASGLEVKKKMKLKTNYRDLDKNEAKQLLIDHDAAIAASLVYTTPEPNNAAATALIARITAAISGWATADGAWDSADAELKSALLATQLFLGQRAGYCNVKTPNDGVNLATTLLTMLDGIRNPSGPTPRVQNVTFTISDLAGHVDPAWDSLRDKASSYDVQSTLVLGSDPNTATWTNHDAVTKSSTTLGPFASGTRLWVRVRATGPNGPGDWSDPATTIVP